MKKRVLFFIFFSMIIITACKTIKEADYGLAEKEAFQSIGPLKASVDIEKIREQLLNSKISLRGSYFGNLSIYKQNDSINIIMQEDTYLDKSTAISDLSTNLIVNRIPDMRAYDLIKSFNFNINANRIPNEPRGYAHLKLSDYKDNRNFPLVFFSIWTLGIPSLIGVPFNSSTTKLSIEVSILNKDFQLVKKYKAEGKGKAFMALYWGYGEDLSRKSNLSAFTEALTSIENQMASDKGFLNNQLSNQH